jgi:hypothetical protein
MCVCLDVCVFYDFEEWILLAILALLLFALVAWIA